ncbi:MAG: bifunctional metallophosphatase/5'-nucleotidase, partial [Anaerolineae bacterium]|nr:bifunctional metallophosphatase/5'-nucleotidase [Anaerolineae bacterium]
FLILSGGDTFTGPALSTWFDGASMIEVMNAMGYDAAAVGNHEFDFGIDGLVARAAEAEFPFLAANIAAPRANHPIYDATLPYVVQEVGGFPGDGTVNVGIVGLASQATPRTTMPTHVADLTFENYAASLAEVVPQARADGAEVVVVTSHLCSPELRALVAVAAELDIAMVGGGHCHERFSRVEQDVALVGSGWQMAAYGRVDLALDPETKAVLGVTAAVKPNLAGEGDAEVQAIVDAWQAELDDALLVTIGYTEDGIGRNTNAMYNMVTDAWLEAYPADIAMSNPGGFRQAIDAGPITLADVVGVLPFDNVLVDVALTGEQVIASYEHGSRQIAVGGLVKEATRYLVNGEPLDPDATYHVLVNDFMYAGGDGYRFGEYDPDAYQTGIDWRQPVIEWISTRNTSEVDPLETYLDTSRR